MNSFKKTEDQAKAIKLLGGLAIYTLLYGGSRSGKTAILVYAVIVRALKAPGSRHLILRRVFKDAKRAIWYDTFPAVAKLIGLEYTENKQDWFISLPGDSQIWVGGLDDKERADRILGNEYSTIHFDEVDQFSYRSIQVALTRLAQRSKCSNGGYLKNRAYFSMNPPTKTHWTYKVFILGEDPTREGSQPLARPELYSCMQMNPEGNKQNIGEDYIENILGVMSERERRRFLHGEFTTDIEGALWTYDMIERNRVAVAPECEKICIAIDPAVTSNPDSDDTGIIVSGKSGDVGYVLEDATGKYTPLGWAEKAVDLYYKWEANYIVAEVNQGGDMIKELIRQVDRNVRVKTVRAKKGKALRAEPVVGLYEQNRIKHAGEGLMKLEAEMTDWDSTDPNAPSPNRIDALTYSFLFLLLKKSVTFVNKSAFAV